MMSCEYRYIERKYVGKYLCDTKYEKSYRYDKIEQAVNFCKIFGLPEIPYYCCHTYSAYNSLLNDINNDSFYLYILKGDYFINNKTVILENIQFPKKVSKKRFLRYKHWQNWGLKKLNNLTMDVIRNKKQLKNTYIYHNEENINQIKSYILDSLNFYKNHYYRYAIIKQERN